MTAAAAWHFKVLADGEATVVAAAIAPGCFEHPQWVRAVACARARAHAFVAIRAQRGVGQPMWLFGAVHSRWGLAVFESMPMGGYGGWVGEQALTVEQEHDLTRAWLRRAPWAVVEMTSRPGREACLPRPGPVRLGPQRLRERLAPRGFSTHLLGLSADEAALLRLVRPSVRSYLRKVDELGFTFDRSDDQAALKRMHQWYMRGSRAWLQPAAGLLPETFFTSLVCPGYADVWTVRYQGQDVGAALFLVGRQEVQYQASGTERIESTLSATEAVVWAAIRHYGQRGLATMNFGASEGLESVARSKKKFGAAPAAYLRTTYLLPGLARFLSAAPRASATPR